MKKGMSFPPFLQHGDMPADGPAHAALLHGLSRVAARRATFFHNASTQAMLDGMVSEPQIRYRQSGLTIARGSSLA